jgi:hypothetical protein
MAILNDAPTTLPELEAAEIEARILDGDILLCSGNHVFSELIRWATDSPWSHVAMAMRVEGLSRVMVLESVEKIGVRTVPFNTFVFGDQGSRPYPGKIVLARHAKVAAAPPATIRKLAAFAVDQLGDPFDAGEIMRIAARITLGSLNRKAPAAFKRRNDYICSEYLAACLDQIGIQPPWDGRGFIAPSDFAADPEVTAIAQVRMPWRGSS